MANAILLAPLPIAAASAIGSATGYDPTHVGNDHAGVVWKSASGTSIGLTLDLGADQVIDSLMLFGVRGAVLPSFTLSTAVAAAPASFTSRGAFPLSEGESLMDGSSVAIALLAGAITARFVRIAVTLGSAGQIQIGRAVIGQRIELARNFAFGGAFGVKDFGSLDFSRRGALLRTRGKRLRTVGISFPYLLDKERDAAIQPLIEAHGVTEPLALLTDPAESPQRMRRCYFGTLVGDVGTVWTSAQRWQWQANLLSFF